MSYAMWCPAHQLLIWLSLCNLSGRITDLVNTTLYYRLSKPGIDDHYKELDDGGIHQIDKESAD
jgi:hypothetical protein